MVLNKAWDGRTLHRGRCSCGITWTSSYLSSLADSMSWHTARNHACVAELVQP